MMADYKLVTDLPNTLGSNFKTILEEDLKKIDGFIKEHTSNLSAYDPTDTFNSYREQLFKEIRAIVMPEMSPLDITTQFENSLIDLNGVTHESLSERVKSDIDKLKSDLIKNQNDTRIIVTGNGTIMHDFTSQSTTLKTNQNITLIGDSVARGSHSNKNYGQLFGEKLNATITNLSVSGAKMSKTDGTSIYEQATKIRNADLVILQGTDDDWTGSIDIGNDKTDIKTFYGAFCQAIETIRLYNKGARIIVLTATRQLPVSGTTIRRKDTDKNALGFTLEDYVNKQVLACTEMNVPVFDAYHTKLIDPYNPAFRVKCMTDGLHPNELGHEVIFYELIKNYYYFYG